MTLTQTVPAYVPFAVEVTSARRLSPSFVRVTFAGPSLADLHPGGPLGPRDTRLKLVVPDVPGQRPGTDIDVSPPDWYRRWLAHDPADRGHLRTYTARRIVTGEATRLEVDFVLHLDADGRGGPAGTWAVNAQRGEPLTLLGPNRHHPDPGGFEWHPPQPVQASTQPVLLIGDETALPAIASILETLPEQYAGEALVEVPCIEDAQQLQAPSGIRVTYLPRNDRPRGAATLQALAARTSGAVPNPGLVTGADEADDDVLWETPSGPAPGLYAWVAGEASVVREVRRTLGGPHGLPRSQVAFMGYWRQGRCEG